MLYLSGIVVTFFLAALLIGKRGKSEADHWLAAWLTAVGLHLSSFYLYISGQSYSHPFLLGLEIPFPLLHGPFLFLYTKALTRQPIPAWSRWAHFLPFLVVNVLLIPFLMESPDHKIYVYQHQGAGYETMKGGTLIAIVISGITYVVLSLQSLARHRLLVQNQYSSVEKVNLAWLRYLIFGLAVIWVSMAFREDTILFTIVVVYVILLGYFGIKQVGIFTQPTAIAPVMEPASARPKYQKSSLDQAGAEKIHRSLQELMANAKRYTDPELTLSDLAKDLNIHPNHLSQVINTFEGKTFYDYVNTLRIEEFKRVAPLEESQRFTLLGLANNCGFNSKTSFNRNFKQATGLSPTEYLRQSHILLKD
ncbi:MAG: AraC family transcriptional regulator [Cyclobacteriaceae bacterium]|nr:AraC family transcriptional regulator [Cyclobacteriaceae bacterium]